MSKKRSVVVHVRLPLSTLIGCYDTIEVLGKKSVANLSRSAAVRDSLNRLIEWLQLEGQIPIYTAESLDERTQKLLGSELKLDIRTDEPKISLSDLFQKPSEEPEDEVEEFENIAKAVESQLKAQSIPHVKEEVSFDEEVEAPAGSTFDTDALELEEWSHLEQMAPKDRFIELANSETLGEEYKLGVQIVYTDLEPHLWGSDLADKQIKSVVRKILSQK